MRRSPLLFMIVPAVLAAAVGLAAADVTKSLRLEYAPGSEPFRVENLAGAFRVVPGSADKVVAIATVHAEDDAMASLIRFERVDGEKEGPALRVRYPLDTYTTYRYAPGGAGEGGGSWLSSWFGGGSNTQTKYEGRRVKVSSSSGVRLYADVEVQLPKGATLSAKFGNAAGDMSGEDVSGTLTFDTGSGDVSLRNLQGAIVADTGSGDIDAAGVEGTLRCDTGSGNVSVNGFSGDRVVADTGSGDVQIRDARAKIVGVDTGSGDVDVAADGIESFTADTGSGNVRLAATGGALKSVKADTGSGDVTIVLEPEAGFEAIADQGSGDIINRFGDAEAIVKDKEIVGYRHGDGRIRIAVSTGSGDLTLKPGT